MTQAEIYRYINALWNTDSLGGAFNFLEYNDAQKEVNLTMFNDAIAELTASKMGPLSELAFSTKMLRRFVVPYTAVPVAGLVNISSLTSYYQFLKMHTTASYQGQIRDIPLIDQADFINRMDNLMREPLKYHPVCLIDSQAVIRIYPSDITSVTIYYLKYPATPKFDYYIDSNDAIQPLAVGAAHVLAVGEVGSSGETAGSSVTSETVELEWGEEHHYQYITNLLRRLGLSNDNTFKFQAETAEKQQLEAK